MGYTNRCAHLGTYAVCRNRRIARGKSGGYGLFMPDSAFATFIADCRQEQAHLIGLIEALEGNRMNPGMPITIPAHLIAPTSATLVAFQGALTQLNALIDAYEANPDA
jgi:hypothetical protein